MSHCDCEDCRARRALREGAVQPAEASPAKFDTPQGFIDWFAKNYNGEVVFSDPAWHARIIFRTAAWHYRALATRPAEAPETLTDEPDYATVLGAVARGWCHDANKRKVMDYDLANAIAFEVSRALATPPTALQEGAETLSVRMEDALLKIKTWAEAYPEDIFHVPTSDEWKRLHEAAKAAGLNGIDAFSAANMRHVITQVQAIVDRALQEGSAKP